MGNVILLVVSFLRNPLALLLHVACGQSKAFAQCLQALSGTRTRLPCVHWRVILRWWLVPVQPRNSSSIPTQVLCRLLKTSRLVAIAAPVAIFFTLGGILAIRPKINFPSN